MRQPWLDLDELLSADPVKGAYLDQRAVDGRGEPLFRFALWRVWNANLPLIAAVMLSYEKGAFQPWEAARRQRRG